MTRGFLMARGGSKETILQKEEPGNSFQKTWWLVSSSYRWDEARRAVFSQ
jgi:hypothetical protein